MLYIQEEHSVELIRDDAKLDIVIQNRHQHLKFIVKIAGYNYLLGINIKKNFNYDSLYMIFCDFIFRMNNFYMML